MPEGDLEERLRSHAESFNSLLQLIPAKLYYGEGDTSDQWQRKKQTKEEARNAKLARLNPDNAKSAKDVMDENARKRKRDEDGDDESFDNGDIEMEQPLKKSKRAIKEAIKRQKSDSSGSRIVVQPDGERMDERIKPDVAENPVKKTKSEARQEKSQRQKSNQERKMAKREAKKARKDLQPASVEDAMADVCSNHQSDEDDDPRTGGIGDIDVPGLFDSPNERPVSTATPSPEPQSPTFDTCAVLSGSSSISSIAPLPSLPKQSKDPSSEEPSQEAKKPKIDPEELRARLQRRIEELRAARKADGLNGKPARNRQELLDARRQKEEQRKARKKELRRKAKEEEREKQRLLVERGSPLLNSWSGSNAAKSPIKGSDSTPCNLTFGRIEFADGHRASAQLSTILPSKTAKGPQDPFTALQGAQHKQDRLSGLDEEKRADIIEKDMWLHAHQHALGERVRDDTSLLKKTLKRKESAKKKSEKAWTERIEGVEKAKAAKQRRREENLKKRRDEKGSKGKGKGKGGKGAKGKQKARPGFEGSFRTKAPRAFGAGAGAGAGDMKRK